MAGRDEAQTRCDASSFETVFRAHYARLCDFVDSYVRSREVASDIVQDLFAHLWERCDAGDDPPLSPTYLYRASRNRALKHIRHRRIVSQWAERAAREASSVGFQADESVRTREVVEAFHQALDKLPDRCREIFLMSREQKLSYAAIAETLGISVKTVETQIWRALKSLRRSLAPYLVLAIGPLARWGDRLLG